MKLCQTIRKRRQELHNRAGIKNTEIGRGFKKIERPYYFLWYFNIIQLLKEHRSFKIAECH